MIMTSRHQTFEACAMERGGGLVLATAPSMGMKASALFGKDV